MSQKFSDYDISPPNFQKDLVFGQIGEQIVRNFLEDILNGSLEVKTDRYRNGRMAVETQQMPGGHGDWIQSGINVTKARWWVYQYSTDGAFHIVSVARLKRYLRANSDKFNEATKKMFAAGSDNPAKGYLLYPEHVLDLLTNPKYDEEQ